MSDLIRIGKEWVDARSSIIDMPMNSPDFMKRLNRLSEAENNLAAAIRSLGKEGSGEQ